ncbi:hypothetical protein NLG97_g967 [Lecanicillium saksenae]|uniref:Uncharacterized protein n=1 Tax=Lecanicillium saksenae TaxID=468837 RepID=A0ACC1R8J3_9HYPO|nr:hypothetical protein NLG97_g967 [Lecanicillium saksenae]
MSLVGALESAPVQALGSLVRLEQHPPLQHQPDVVGARPAELALRVLGSVSNNGAGGGRAGAGGIDDLLHRELAERYFRGFHKWLPIISPSRFHEAAAQAQSGGAPPADFSLLVMAMYLVSMPQGPQSGEADQSGAPMSTYLMIKMLFAQTQAVICASTALVQAGLMIAAYEYACQKLNPAYISIGTCVRIAHALSLDKTSSALGEDGPQLEPEQKLRMLEDWNVWWGVVVLERIIMVELAQVRSQPAAELPAQGSILPTDLKPERDCRGISPIDTDLLQRAPEAPFEGTKVQSFGRQAQAVYLLDRVIRISSLASGTESRQAELQQLDRDIQAFLGMVLEECERLREFRCSVVATAVRALFILHENALSQEVSALGENSLSHQRLLSEAVLDTVTNIVSESVNDHAARLAGQPQQYRNSHGHGQQHQHAEGQNGHSHGHGHGHSLAHGHDDQQHQIGQSHAHGGIDTLPLCCIYSLKCAKRHIDRRQQQGAIEPSSKDLEPILSINKALLQRWSVTY